MLQTAALLCRFRAIDVAGATALAAALCTNATLATLNLELNAFGDAGNDVFAEALHTNVVLTSLKLRCHY